jgi:Flp pilus assembly secretin CpaC
MSAKAIVLALAILAGLLAVDGTAADSWAADHSEAHRDRTEIRVQGRAVLLSSEMLRKVREQPQTLADVKDGALALERLEEAAIRPAAARLDSRREVDLIAALPEFERLGVLQVIDTVEAVTHHLRPAKAANQGDWPPPGVRDKRGWARFESGRYASTLSCFPRLTEQGTVCLHLNEGFRVEPTADAGNVASPQSRSVTTDVQLADGQTVIFSGLAGPDEALLLFLVTVHLQPPGQEAAFEPLSPAERDQRRRQQMAFLQEEISPRFPRSKIRLVGMEGQIVVQGMARDDQQRQEILKAVYQRAVAQWRLYPAVPSDRPQAAEPGAGPVVDLMRCAPAAQVQLRMKFLELDGSAARRDVAAPNQEGKDAEAMVLVSRLLELTEQAPSALIDGLAPATLDACVTSLTKRGLLKTGSSPTLVTADRHEAQFVTGQAIPMPSLGGTDRELQDSRRREPFAGLRASLWPIIGDDNRLRLDVRLELGRLLQNSTNGGNPMAVIGSRLVSAVVVMHPGQTLALHCPEGSQDGDGDKAKVLLVTPEVIQPLEAEPGQPGPVQR